MQNLQKYLQRCGRSFCLLSSSLFLVLLLSLSLYAHDNIYVHPYIAEQAFLLWPRDANHEIYKYLGLGYRDTTKGDQACSNARDGSKITEGTKEEDDFNPLTDRCNSDLFQYGYSHHFMDPDLPDDNNGLDYPGGDDPGAYWYANVYWEMAVSYYPDINTRGLAYWYLGRIAHLLADLSVPAHVHLDPHIPIIDPDSYEKYMEDNYTKWGYAGATKIDKISPIPLDWTLRDLFYNLDEKTQSFPSNDYPFQNYIFSANELRTIGNTLMPLAIQYTSALYKLFWVETHSVNPTIAMTPMSGPPGTTFKEWGTGFTPYGTATLHFLKPDGSEYTPTTLTLDSIGHFEITYNSETNKPPGQYSWYAIDNTTGIKSNVVTFSITSQNYSISGKVTLNQNGLSGVAMNLSGSAITSTITDASGNYTFSGLLNGSYMITPERTGYAFTPKEQIVNISNNSIKNVNFSAVQTLNPTIAMTPMSGPPGTTFKEWGTGFTPYGTATLYFPKYDGINNGSMTLTLDSIGHFEIPYNSETNKPPGTYSWNAIDNTTGIKSNVVTFTITKPTIAMTPMSGPPGTTFKEWGTGFTPNNTATLHFLKPDGSEYTPMTLTLDSIGHFEITYNSETSKPPGEYSWYAIDNATGYKSNVVTFTIIVKPTIAMTPMSGPPGTTFVEWGTGFTPNGTATLYFPKYDGTHNGSMTLTLDSIGHFEITYNSETNKPIGKYSWYAIDNTTGKKSNTVTFTITK